MTYVGFFHIICCLFIISKTGALEAIHKVIMRIEKPFYKGYIYTYLLQSIIIISIFIFKNYNHIYDEVPWAKNELELSLLISFLAVGAAPITIFLSTPLILIEIITSTFSFSLFDTVGSWLKWAVID